MPVQRIEGEWLTPSEAAQYLRVAHSTIYRWARSGLVKLYRIGEGATRLKRSEVEALAHPLPPERARPVDLAKREASAKNLLAMRSRLAGRALNLGGVVMEERKELEGRA